MNRCLSQRSSRKMALTPASEKRLRDRLATAQPVVRLLFLLALTAILVLGQRDAAAQSQKPSPASQASQTETFSGGNAENGKKLFIKYGCYECHGYQGQGSMLTGARLAPNPIPLSALIAYCRKPNGEMPPFSAKLVSDQDLTDIHAYLRSLPRPPDAKTIPILQQ